MKTYIAAAVLALVVGSQARAGDPLSPYAGTVPLRLDHLDSKPAHRGLGGRALVFDARTGDTVPVVTRLHPVIGSTQRVGHKKYTTATYNPVLGSFGTHTFRR